MILTKLHENNSVRVVFTYHSFLDLNKVLVFKGHQLLLYKLSYICFRDIYHKSGVTIEFNALLTLKVGICTQSIKIFFKKITGKNGRL